MSAKWTYRGEDGKRLAELSLDAPPPLDWAVSMVGPKMGPVREYHVIAVDAAENVLVLRSGAPS